MECKNKIVDLGDKPPAQHTQKKKVDRLGCLFFLQFLPSGPGNLFSLYFSQNLDCTDSLGTRKALQTWSCKSPVSLDLRQHDRKVLEQCAAAAEAAKLEGQVATVQQDS